MKQRKGLRRALGMLLAVLMIVNLPGMTMFAFAEDEGESTVTEQATDLGLSGKALQITTTGGAHVVLSDFESMSNGIYEITFCVPWNEDGKVPGNVGFLARYADESQYAGLSIDLGYQWTSHYSTGSSSRGNVVVKNVSLEPGVTYRVKITYEGSTMSFAYMQEGDAEYTELGTDTITDAGYTGTGVLAMRLNAGDTGIKTIVVDNIVQSDLEGTVKKTMDFEDIEDVSSINYAVYLNKGTAASPDNATLTLVDVVDLPQAPTAAETLAAAKTTVEGATYTAASSEASDATAAKAAVESKLSALGLDTAITAEVNNVDNGFTAAVDGTEDEPTGTAGSYKFTVTLSMDGAESVTTGELTMTITQAAYVEPEPEVLTDPGLPEVEMAEGDDDYNQNVDSSVTNSSIVDASGTAQPAVNINQEAFGMDGYALKMASGDDYRVKFTEFKDMADGAYEIAFKINDTVPTTLGFLVRYADESQYAGLSIDDSGATWAGHYSTGLSTRNNPSLTNSMALQANTTYMVRIEYSGANVTIKAKWEGQDDWYTMGSYTISGGYTGAGGFAIRLRGGTGVPITFDNIKQYDANGDLVMTMNFNDREPPETETRVNKSNTLVSGYTTTSFVEIPASETVDGFTPGRGTKIVADAAGVYVDNSSPSTSNPTYTVQLSGTEDQIGLVFNYQDANNYAAIWYDGSKWVAGGKVDGADVATIDLSEKNIPAPTVTRTYRISYDESSGYYTLTVSGGPGADVSAAQSYNLGELSGIFTGKGKVGLYVGEAMTLYAGPIQVIYVLESVDIDIPEDSYITLTSDEMQVLVGKDFPYVYAYQDLSGTNLAYGVLPGNENSGMTIGTGFSSSQTAASATLVACTTTSKLLEQSEDGTSATYEITATGTSGGYYVNATFTVVLTVSGKTLKLEVTDVDTAADSDAVRTFAFTNNPMVSLAGMGAGAALGRVSGTGPTSDVFLEVKGASSSSTTTSITYALLYDRASESVAAIENNAENGQNKYSVDLVPSGDTPYISIENNAWAWQYYDSIDPTEEELPYATVVIGGDENEDGSITWQDAGIAYRDIMKVAYGAEDVKNEWMFIAMNMSSQTSQPFLRVLDLGKAISYLTDGFGMKIMNKGYQAGGHDDSHGDYDFVGLQQGGADDFNTLIDVGLEYGIKNGVHLNATEFALDGFDTLLEDMQVSAHGLIRNWNWFDQAYLVNKSIDVSSGHLEERVNEFAETLPNLAFVYLDVYQAGSRYIASQLVKYFNSNGMTMGTEYLGDLNQNITFVHWNTDMYYSTGGTQSEVMKFVTFGLGDLNAPDKVLLGALMPGIADWRNTNQFSDGVDVFYRNNLPTKYLQHFELLSWTPNEEAIFSDGVKSTVDGDITTITKDGKVIAKLNTSTIINYEDYSGQTPSAPSSAEIFIPWSPEVEDKIYCYSDSGNFGTWEVPDSWSGVTTAYLYELTTTGRTFVTEVTVSDGKVTLDLEAGVPYILTMEAEEVAHRYNTDGSVMTDEDGIVYLPTLEEHPYGEGTLINDPGFYSETLDAWDIVAETGDADDVYVVEDQYEQAMLYIAPEFGGTISQTLTDVEPGKTYSLSVWVKSTGDRPVTLQVTAGNVVESSTVDTTGNFAVQMKPSKFTGDYWQRLKVTITIPEDVDTAVLTLYTVAGDTAIYADDVRSWAWIDLNDPEGTSNPGPSEESENYYYYEDFEHIDEGWGPFVSNVTNQPYVNLAYKDPTSDDQIKTYVVDASETNLTSLKGQQNGSFGTVGGTGGIIMRTLTSTLNFEKGSTYTVSFDHQTYLEYQGTDGYPAGYNAPLSQAAFYIDVRHADGTLIATYALEPGVFDDDYVEWLEYITENEPTTIDASKYDVHPETQTLTFTVDATEEDGIFLTFRIDMDMNTTDSTEPHTIFAIDNFCVIKNEPESLTDALAIVEGASYSTTQSEVSTAEAAKAEAQALVDALELGEDVTAVVNDGIFLAATAGTSANPDGVNGSYSFTVTLTKGDDTTTTEALLLVITSTTYTQPYIPPTSGGNTSSGETDEVELEEPELPFADVPADIWYEEALRYVYENGIMEGVGDNQFNPYGLTTRGTIVTMLYRLEGEPEADAPDFADVAEGTWYSDAVGWASANGIVNGYGNGNFGPDDNVTREEMAIILYNYAVFKGYDMSATGDLSVFTDSADVSSWALDQMIWAVGTGLISGKGDGILDPAGTATRVEVAQLFLNFHNQYEAS